MESIGSKLSKIFISKLPFKEYLGLSGNEFWYQTKDSIFKKPFVVKPNRFRDLNLDTIDLEKERYYRIYPQKNNSDKIIIYFHGGAFIFNIFPFHFNMLYDILSEGNIEALVPLYPLLPDADANEIKSSIINTYKLVLEAGIDSKKIILMGDSSGGYLSLLLMHLIKKEKLPEPNQIVLISPLLDLCKPPDIAKELEKKDPFISIGCREELLKVLGKDKEVTDPLVSPRFGDMRTFPKTDIISGTSDLLHVQAISFYEDKKDEFDLTLHLFENMMHDFPIIPIIEGFKARKLIKNIIE